ncbi:MAG: hypothetical protein AAF962_22030 [Actinomycetota bacterium]
MLDGWGALEWLWLAASLLALLHLLACGFLFHRLSLASPADYEELGSPSLRPPRAMSIGDGLKLFRYIWSGRYRNPGDARLARLGIAVRATSVLGLLGAFTLWGWVAVSVFSS